jgi:hypothetical protein
MKQSFESQPWSNFFNQAGLEDQEQAKLKKKIEEKREKELAYEQELAAKSKELGLRLLLPNHELPELDINDEFCQQREYLLEPEAYNTKVGKELMKKGKIRALADWEKAGSGSWHDDELDILQEMAKRYPNDPLYSMHISGESYHEFQARKTKVIKNWEGMKDKEQKV